jgi:tetratricopeptide (TPR) repeat protein
MAPEQLQGRPSRASDQYSMGIVAYEWLSGDVPFHGAFVEIASQHMLVPPPPLREKVPTLSPVIEQVVLKALEKESQKRFASVREFAQALVTAVGQARQTVYAPPIEAGPLVASIPPTIDAAPPQNTTPASQKTKEQWLVAGNAHYNAGQYKEAIAAYDRAIQLDPKDAKAYNNRATIYRFLHEYQRAIIDYSRAIELNPKYAWAYGSRGFVYSDLKEYKKAIADYDRAIALDPNLPGFYGRRGEAYHMLKQYQRAIHDFDHALELDPEYTWARTRRDEAYQMLKGQF